MSEAPRHRPTRTGRRALLSLACALGLVLGLVPVVPGAGLARVAAAADPSDLPPSSDVIPVAPARMLDTRPGGTTIDGFLAGTGRLQPNAVRHVQVNARGGLPFDSVAAVVLNVTAVNPAANGHVTVFPTGVAPPNASNVNLIAGRTTPNLVLAKVGTNGRVSFVSSVATDLLVDLTGWVPKLSDVTPLQPARLLDTRADGQTVDGQFRAQGTIGPGAERALQVLGRGGVPADGVSAVVLNVVAVLPTAPGHARIWPAGQPRPTASNVNFVPGETTSNLVVAKVGADGKVAIYNSHGANHYVADVAGWIPAASGLTSLQPARLLDTRAGGTTVDGGSSGWGPVGPGNTIDLKVTGRGGVPASGVGAVLVNVTPVGPSTVGHTRIWPTGEARPVASTHNYVPGLTTPNLVLAKVGSGGRISIFSSSGHTHFVVDVAGWTKAPALGRCERGAANGGNQFRLLFEPHQGCATRWDPCQILPWYYDPTGAQLTLAQVQAIVQEVADVTGLDLVYGGVVPASQDEWLEALVYGIHIGWGHLEPGTVGLTQTFAYDDMIVTASVALEQSPVPLAWSTVLLHELGHAVGLDHVLNPQVVMHPYLDQLAAPYEEFQPGDVTGLGYLGIEQGCVLPFADDPALKTHRTERRSSEG